ncbi:hypothetical protein [Myceligenerans crystallogenes]|uniref:DUF2076 domain-containing protein n=1 Tax=Myceligenerans crystallogenes TaxID=316335 RepID=A0ABP4ZQN1_9MICO
MGFLDRLLGREPKDPYQQYGPYGGQGGQAPAAGPQYGAQPSGYQNEQYQQPAGSRDPDQVAIDRYKYMLRTAPPEAVEQAHEEAFAKLTPEQRRKVLQDLNAQVPPHEQAMSDDPRTLARTATRAEMREPGTLQRSFGGGGGPGFGTMLGASLLGTIGGMVIGSAVANAMFGPEFGDPTQEHAADAEAGAEGSEGDAGSGEEAGAGEGGDAGDAGAVEASGGDAGAADAGGGFFDGGGDFGGGDFGGGDFGGGDFGGF